MQSPWQILGLNPSAATEKDAKIAYARLIREHRPDTDPEGFQRVREAYEIGLELIRTKPAETPSPPPSEAPAIHVHEPEPVNAGPPALAPSLLEAEAAVANARASGNQTAISKSIGHLYYICASLTTGCAAIRLWQESLHRATDGQSELVARAVSIPQLIAELEAGTSIINHACITCWEQAHDMGAIRQLAEGILAEPQRVNEAEASVVALRLALELAFVDAALATRLNNFAFPHLDRETRESVIRQIERQCEMGEVFAECRKDQKQFWHRRFRRPNGQWNWSEPAADAAIEYLSRTHELSWTGYELIRNLAPQDWFSRMEAALLDKQTSASTSTRSANLDPEPERSGSGKSSLILPWLGWACSIAVLLAALAFGGRKALDYVRGWQINSVAELANKSLAVETSSTPKSAANYAAGMTESRMRIEEMRKNNPNIDTWTSLLLGIHRQAVNVPPARLKADPNMDALRLSAQGLFRSIAKSESDSTIERLVLERLLLDVTTPEILKQEVIFRQQETQPLGSFLKCWQLAARSSAANETLIATAARWYMTNKGDRLSVDDAERAALTELSNAISETGPVAQKK